MAGKKQVVSLDNKKLTLSNMDKVLYPESKIVKAELIQYYLQIAHHFIDFAKSRPISMIRYPDGIDKTKFYSKNLPDYAPSFIQSKIYTDDGISYPIIDSRPALLWMANMASLEIHGDNVFFEDDEYFIDHIIIDLDPPEDFSFEKLKKLALNMMEELSKFGMTPYIKTSGSKGVHIYVPIYKIEPSDSFFEQLKTLSVRLAEKFPKEVTMAFRKNKRSGKVFVDILRNRVSQTCVLPFSTRAISTCPVSMPLFIDDFKEISSSRAYTIFNAPAYLAEKGNPWKDFHLDASDFFGSGPKGKKSSLLQELHEDWFEEPSFEHQLASEVKKLSEYNSNLIYENKWDGIRVFIYVNGSKVKVLSRNNRDITKQFPDIVKVFQASKSTGLQFVFDAEIVSTDTSGKPIFSQVISRLHQKSSSTHKYSASAFVFDIVVNEGMKCHKLPWEKRRRMIEKAKLIFPSMKLSEVYSDGKLLLDAVKNMEMEGIMIKKKKAPYSFGERTSDWSKLKIRHQSDCFIIGYTAGSGDRSPYFGSFHLAEAIENTLIYRGKVGTGWDHKKLKELHGIFHKLEKQEAIPFDTIKDVSESTWLQKPYLGCTIKYASFTSTGTYREPVFLKLNEEIYD